LLLSAALAKQTDSLVVGNKFNGHPARGTAVDQDEYLIAAVNHKNTKQKIQNMEALIFAFIAVQNLFIRPEPMVAETATLQPLDLQALRYVYGTNHRSESRSNERNDSHLAQALS